MEELLRKVKKELENIGDKGLSSSNLDTTYKLIDIYKDIKEACYYEDQVENDTYGARGRGRGRGRYRDDDDYDNYGRQGSGSGGGRSNGYGGNYGHFPLDERTERQFDRMREGMYNYNEGKNRYRDGDSKQRMIDGVEMTMGAIVNFIESMVDFAETPSEKEIVRKYVDKLKNI